MQYKIRNTLIPVPESHRQPLLSTLSMYDRGEDLTDSPLIKSRVNLTHMSVYKAISNGIPEEEALRQRQSEFIALYEAIKRDGYDNGSVLWCWFDDNGFIHIYDGFHRLPILEHLGLDIEMSVETSWTGGANGQHKGRDFPLAEVLWSEHPKGSWLYQPVHNGKVSGWNVDRRDSPQRLEHILRGLVGETVLDIGCSEGYFSREIAKRGYKVTSIDMQHGFIAAARYLSILEGVNVDYHEAKDWKEFLDENGPYDNILFLSVIHNDMKKIGVEDGLKKLEAFRGKAKRVFFEAPREKGEREWMVPGFPQFNFLEGDSVQKVEDAMGLKALEMWSTAPGTRPMFTYDNGEMERDPQVETVLVTDVNDCSMYVIKDDPIITPWIIKTRLWEPELTEFLKRNLKEGQTFVDVGANVGYHSLLASKLVGSTGKVYAFEPAQDSYDVLLKNIELNNCQNIMPIQKAVSSKIGPVKLFSYGLSGDAGRRGLSNPKDRDGVWRTKNPVLRESGWSFVNTTRLSDVLSEPPDFIKVDVEGDEVDALEGMRDILKQGKTELILEDEPHRHPIHSRWITEELNLNFSEAVKESRSDLKHFIYKPTEIPWWDLTKWLPDHRDQYWPLFNTLRHQPCRNIMEIGTHDGNNAVAMIKAAAQKVPEEEIHYYGFDLFEDRTKEVTDCEFSPATTVNIREVKAHIREYTTAEVTLIKGDTRKTLEQAVKTLPNMDLIYIDGGHSTETTRNDWNYASMLIGKNTTVYFDDYNDEMPFIGSHFIVGELDKEYQAQVMINTNYYKRPFGRLKCQLLRVTLRRPPMKLKVDHFRFHLISLPHSRTVKDWGPCAFTQLTYRFSQLMHDMGHDVFHYGTEGAQVTCTEHIDVLTEAVQKQAYGDWDPWKQLWIHNGKDLAYTTFKKNTINELKRRKEPGDILLISNGNWLREISDVAGGGIATVEPFVGYLGFFSKYKVFPSYAWMHHMYGKISRSGMSENFVTGNWYDAVIPHFFDPADHTFEEEKDDYFLYLGRLIQRKGINVAVDLCKRAGAKLVVSGQPMWPDKVEESLAHVGVNQSHCEYVGVANFQEADRLRGKAKAVIIPSMYMEPFGLVVVEALLSGTPVITTDWGAFPEIVKHGEVGYRCRTMDDFIWAANNIDNISPAACREYAVANYSMERISKAYQEYFTKVHDLFGKGWYTEHPERKELDWLRRY